MAIPERWIKRRIITMLVIFSIVAVSLLVRTFYIQFVNGDELKKSVFLQHNKDRTIDPWRGTIYDANGKELAISVPVFTIVANPIDVQKSKMETDAIARGIAAILELQETEVLGKLVKENYYQILKKKVDIETGELLKTWIEEKNIKGITFYDDYKRYYPYNNLAAHVIDFEGEENKGVGGIENIMDKYLRGLPGRILGEVDLEGY